MIIFVMGKPTSEKKTSLYQRNQSFSTFFDYTETAPRWVCKWPRAKTPLTNMVQL